jgi:hypothetical protein
MAQDTYRVEIQKDRLLIEVVFENSTQPDPRAVSAEEWVISARDPRTSEKLWSDRFSYWEWFDHFGDAERELPDEEWFEGMGDQLIAFLEALLRSKVRLAQVEEKPLVRLLGWRYPGREKTTLQLLIGDEWTVWNKIAPLDSGQAG